MRIPVWLTLGVAAIVLGFGSYRVFLAFRKDRDEGKPKRGLYAMSKRAHLMVGAVYILLGIGLVATSFGFNPFGGGVGPDTTTPTKDTAPSPPGSVPKDQLAPVSK
jgi:hypothetical protein